MKIKMTHHKKPAMFKKTTKEKLSEAMSSLQAAKDLVKFLHQGGQIKELPSDEEIERIYNETSAEKEK